MKTVPIHVGNSSNKELPTFEACYTASIKNARHCIIPVDLNCLLLRVGVPKEGILWDDMGCVFFLRASGSIVEGSLSQCHEVHAALATSSSI